MVYVAWFASFSFLSAMTFLQAFFQVNHSLRFIRVCFMFILGSMMIVALLPTGSKDWMNLACPEGVGCFYPSLEAICYYRQMPTKGFNNGRTKIYSMVVSVLVIGISYINIGVKLFDPTSSITRRYLRIWPGKQVKRVLRRLDQWSQNGRVARAIFWTGYLVVYSAFTSARALFDIAESMLGEVCCTNFLYATLTEQVFRSCGSPLQWHGAPSKSGQRAPLRVTTLKVSITLTALTKRQIRACCQRIRGHLGKLCL